MKRKSLLALLCGTVLFVTVPLLGHAEKMEGYVGSGKCQECHMDQFNKWQASGHPWKLRKMEKARYAKLPLPPGYMWEDVSYVIGGANKKSRYIDLQGYVITAAKDGSEAKTQYNIQDGSWSFYHKGEKKPYKCGPCHMTAYSKKGHQDGLPGMIGTWAEDGVGCEECHGPGAKHTAQKEPTKDTIKVDKSGEMCGKCHQRGGKENPPPAKGGFIRHHEQFNEVNIGPHQGTDCIECHDAHARADNIKQGCTSCHDEGAYKAYATTTLHGKTGIPCFACHMPKATKSAIKVNKFTGDVRTHIIKINVDANANMFETVTKGGKKKSFAKNFVTLDYTCLGCHGSRDRNWAAKNAKNFHKTK